MAITKTNLMGLGYIRPSPNTTLMGLECGLRKDEEKMTGEEGGNGVGKF